VFSAYRIDQFAEPESFKISLGAVLEQYPDEVMTYVCDPRTGIQRRLKWPPTISEMVEACDDHQAFLERTRRQKPAFKERSPGPLLHERPQGYMAQVFVPEGNSRYAKLCEWAKNANPIWWKYGKSSDNRNGIWVSHIAWNGLPDPK
jgi:hypothetical protein